MCSSKRSQCCLDVVVAIGQYTANDQYTAGRHDATKVGGEVDQRRSKDVGHDHVELAIDLG